MENEYKLKNIQLKQSIDEAAVYRNIIIQNSNGPCPLIALCNVLILRDQIKIPQDKTAITYDELAEQLGNCAIENISADSQIKIADVFNLIPTLQTGLDINPRFDNPLSFDSSVALDLFSIFNVQLCHGWIVDTQDTSTFNIITSKGSYNNVMEALVAGDIASTNLANQNYTPDEKNQLEKLVHETIVCNAFLSETASQLTALGLLQLFENMSSNSLSVLFRNNHFLVLFKHQTHGLFTLVTDQGYLGESDIVWESLTNLEGDSHFYNGCFKLCNSETDTFDYIDHTSTPVGITNNHDEDLAFALDLQQKEEMALQEYRNRTKSSNASASANVQETSSNNFKESTSSLNRNKCIMM